ncbi:MAG: dihydroorotate dehydrogenase electron transfer subunit [Thermodesulforhabdaceae bacterium]
MKKHLEKAIIIENRSLTASIYHLVLKAPDISKEARPGQFVMVRISDGLIPLLRRPFSFFRIRKDEGIVEIAYRLVGKGTMALSRKKEGEELDLLGPLGNGFRLPPAEVKTVWVLAGGIGIASVMSLIEEIRLKRPDVHLVLYYGAKSSSDFLSISELSRLCSEVKYSTDDGSFGFCGSVLGCAVNDCEASKVLPSYLYACGPPVMLAHVAKWALQHNIPSQFSLESLMGCGVGACLGCAIPKKNELSNSPSYVHVCFEGPVFSPDVIKWEQYL